MTKQMVCFIVIIFSIKLLFSQHTHQFNQSYTGIGTDRIAFPIGGMGSGMFTVEGTGSISHMSVRNNPALFNEPVIFAALAVKNVAARVLEGPVPGWKKFGMEYSGDGSPGANWGLPRMQGVAFTARFPFASIELSGNVLPVKASIKAWSPFIPTDENSSGYPIGALEYTFTNNTPASLDYVFSYHSENFMKVTDTDNYILPTTNGFILSESGTGTKKELKGDFAIFTDDPATVVDHAWFRGGFYDALSMVWNHVERGEAFSNAPLATGARGASLYVPFKLKAGETKTIRVYMCWYVPDTKMRFGWSDEASQETDYAVGRKSPASFFHKPWYSSQFKSIQELISFWKTNCEPLRKKTELFTKTFYNSSLPPEVIEAVAANLTILKSTTVLRQYDGRFWGWEGSHDNTGSCPGSCTHVWNYAQAVAHLFPRMERSLRETEFGENQDSQGHQSFRSMIPIRPMAHNSNAAADGQLGGLMKMYRDWRISGDTEWMKKLYPLMKLSLDYCIRQWDPRSVGLVEEPHHNTYDIEFWGANGFTTSFYLGALEAFVAMSDALQEDALRYRDILAKGKIAMEAKLYNGEYFYQKIQTSGLNNSDPVESAKNSFGGAYSPDAMALYEKEGPKYQYGTGCLSDGVVGVWLARVCGLPSPVDTAKVGSHLRSVFRYNFKRDLSGHANPQRPTYALGKEGGLLLCSWPKGGRLSLPFIYSNEVWTGIEYQVASHLIFTGHLEQGLEIVRTLRKRYDGSVRNPFDEYECGHWYARAMSSYTLIEACTGVRYDAVDKTLYVDSRVGNFVSFLSTATGYGNVMYKKGKVSVRVASGSIDIKKIIIGKSN